MPRLLVVEDDDDLLGALERQFRAAGYEVVCARTGVEALNKARAAKPDLVILDVMLPGMSGLEVCRRLRTEDPQAGLPIIMLSALGKVPDKVKGLEVGADDYVTKPFDLRELLARVKARLEGTGRLTGTKPTREAFVVGFLGAKGGVGTTTTAANVAGALALRGQQVVIVDLQPWPSAMGLYLGLDLADAQSRWVGLAPAEITPERVAASLISNPRGLRVLLPSPDPDAKDQLTTDRVDALLKSCAALADFVVVDLPRVPSPTTRSALPHCDLVVMLVEPVASCVRLAKRTMDLVKAWGVPLDGIHAAIVYRLPWATPLGAEAVARALGCTLLGTVPPHADLSAAAIDAGKLIVASERDSVAANAFTSLAAAILATRERT
jgi:DNA-binding response OmpR family regulator